MDFGFRGCFSMVIFKKQLLFKIKPMKSVSVFIKPKKKLLKFLYVLDHFDMLI